MQLINLRQRPAAIALIAPWHFTEWGALFPDRSLADFAAELALCLSNDVLPQTWLLQDAAGEMWVLGLCYYRIWQPIKSSVRGWPIFIWCLRCAGRVWAAPWCNN